jgi:hypothetical protein
MSSDISEGCITSMIFGPEDGSDMFTYSYGIRGGSNLLNLSSYISSRTKAELGVMHGSALVPTSISAIYK